MKRTLSLFLCALVFVLGLLTFGASAETYAPDADGLYTVPLSFEATSEYLIIVLKGEYDQTNYIEAYNNAPDSDILYFEQKMSDENGNVTFGPFATNGYYNSTIIIGGYGFEEPYLAGYLSAEGVSNAASVEILGVEQSYTVKGVESEDVVIEVETGVFDSFGYPSLTNEKVEYSLSSSFDDVTIEENVITISKIAAEQAFSVTASVGSVSKTVYVQVKREEAVAAYIEVYADSSFSSVIDSIDVLGPEGGYPDITVYAKTFDQYCQEVEDEYGYTYNGESVGQTFTPVSGTASLKITGNTGVEKIIDVVTSTREDYKSSALELYNLIADCRARLAEEKIISLENGRDVFPNETYTTQARVDAFETAINNAKAALEKYGSAGYSDTDYRDEVSTLTTALSTYNKSFKNGSRVDIEEISIEDQDVKIIIGSDVELKLTTYPKLSATTDRIVWTSSNNAVATVDEYGFVESLSGGKVVITAETRGGLKATTEVTVIKPATRIELTPRTATSVYGAAATVLTASISPLDYSDEIEWTVTEKGDILDIIVSEDNKTCTIIPKSAGEAKVMVKALHGNKSATSTVVVEMPAWEKAAKPVADLDSGSVLKGTQVSLETETGGATIYYTLDGTTPSKDNGRIYRTPIVINQNLTLKAIAVGENHYDSEVAVYDYNIVSSAIRVDSVSVRPGATVVVNISIEDMVDVKEAVFAVKYNSDQLYLDDIEYTCEYVDEESCTGAGAGVHTGYETYQIVLAKEDGFTYDGQIASLTFKIKEDAPEGDYPIEIVNAYVTNVDGTTYSTACFNGNINVNDFVIGDADDNGKIGLSDVIIIKQYLAGDEYAKNNIDLDAADVDADGDVDNDDVSLLSRYCVGWNVTLG